MQIDNDRFEGLVTKVDTILSNHLPHIYQEQIRNGYRHRIAAALGITGFVALLIIPDSAPVWDYILKWIGV